METTVELGSRGEQQAAAFLVRKGYRILKRNYRHGKAEIDLVAQVGEVLVIVEVKTRTGAFYEALSESIPPRKIRRLVAAANHLAQELRWAGEVRFDVVQVLRTASGYNLIHLEDAFYHF
ncbi:YraN family protein [Robiginitalea sp. M366]|uniref:YraN family protein n=1 Tax=Robiginitalea aestuariiviva TaxID=3036903 RepID=UPI00240E365E|nr:YraN family protein [Robiginitalea aestuariiviva]MDG1571215.1 YraN family protein [Robiginitalea aestuariiviva]